MRSAGTTRRRKGEGTVRLEDSKPYVYGDSLANLNLHETLKNACSRQGGGLPIRLHADDYVVHETEYQTRCATVVLIDMSGSMGRYGKYAMTKKVALALLAMVRAQYAGDSLRMIGFYTFASVLTERQLLNSAPKPISIYDSRVRMRFDLDTPPQRVPQHFTNIDAGLRLARSHLARQAAQNKQIIVITDGEPTAHIEGREVVLIYPPSEQTARATLAEVKRCASSGIRISSFALIEDYFYTGSSTSSRRWPAPRKEWPPTARPTISARSSSTASSAAAARAAGIRHRRSDQWALGSSAPAWARSRSFAARHPRAS